MVGFSLKNNLLLLIITIFAKVIVKFNKVMNTAELKSDLQRLIVETNDISILSQMYEYLKRLKNAKTSDWWNSLSHEQQEFVSKGLADLEMGNTYTDEEVRKSVHQRIMEAQ